MKPKAFNLKELKSTIKRILIVYWGPLGDTLAVTPLLELLNEGFPKAKITYIMGGPENRFGTKLLENNPHVDKCMQSDISIIKKILTDEPFDLAIDLCANRFSHLLSRISTPYVKVWGRFKDDLNEFFCLRRRRNGRWPRPVKITLKKGSHKIGQFLQVPRILGIKPVRKLFPKIYLSQKEKKTTRRFLKRIAKKKSFIVGMHPGGFHLWRLWEMRNYAHLADRLIEKLNAKVFVFYGPKERKFADGVCKFSQHKLIKVFRKDLRQYISLVSGCDAFITSDGGPLHIALALGIPCIGIFRKKISLLYWYAHWKNSHLFFNFLFRKSDPHKNKEVERIFKKARFILQHNFKNKVYERNSL